MSAEAPKQDPCPRPQIKKPRNETLKTRNANTIRP